MQMQSPRDTFVESDGVFLAGMEHSGELSQYKWRGPERS